MPAMFLSKLRMRAAATAAVTAASAGAPSAGDSDVTAADARVKPGVPMASARSLFATLRSATAADVPVQARLLQDLKPAEELLAVHDLVTSLHDNARPSDAILCTAWLESYGLSKYVETNHPFRQGEALNGTLEFPGAKSLRVWLHPMCATPTGVSLTLTANGATIGTYSGVATTATGDRKLWSDVAIDVPGNTVTYAFTAPVDATNSEGLWGVGVTVTAVGLAARDKEALLQRKIAAVSHCVRPLMTLWTPAMDAELCELARRICDVDKGSVRVTRSVLTLPVDEVCIRNDREALTLQSISTVPLVMLRLRFALLQHFNSRLHSTLHCFELGSSLTWSTGYKLRGIGQCVFNEVKMKVLDSALAATTGGSSGSPPTVRLSNFDATSSAARGDVDPDDSECIFVQAFRTLRDVDGKTLRNQIDSGQSKVFEVRALTPCPLLQ